MIRIARTTRPNSRRATSRRSDVGQPSTGISPIFQSLANWFGFGPKSYLPNRDSHKQFPLAWQRYLRENVWQYRHLRPEYRQRVDEVVSGMTRSRRWTGGSGFEVTDEMRVTIAGQAALMTLGLDEPYYFDKVPDIIVYEKPFFLTREQASNWSTDPIFGLQADEPRLGEAWHRGPIVLAWESIVQPYTDGHHISVVVHEFTHHLDGLDGDMSGTPPMTSLDQERDWYRVTEADYFQLVGSARRDEATLLSHYGATNRAEFFAVASECFFERPGDLREQHPHLYEVLATYFRQSPADFLPRASQPSPQRETEGEQANEFTATLRPSVSRDPFARGIAEYQEGHFAEAVESFTEVIALNPEDGEAYAERAFAHLELDQPKQAFADAEAALALDSDDNDALTIRGCALAVLGDYDRAVAELLRACTNHDSAEARRYLGYAYLELDRPQQALHQLALAIAIDPYNAQHYLWRAEAYEALGNLGRAEDDRERAEQLEPMEP